MTEQENIVTLTQTEGIATLIARLRKEESRCASVYIIDAAIETIERLVNERDKARREAYRYWLILQCRLEADLGSIADSKRLSKIYSDEFGGEYFNDCSSEDPPPYGFKTK
jgi:hypothetical protein